MWLRLMTQHTFRPLHTNSDTVPDSFLISAQTVRSTNLNSNSTHTSLPPTHPSTQHPASSVRPVSSVLCWNPLHPVQRQARPNPGLKAIISLAPPASFQPPIRSVSVLVSPPTHRSSIPDTIPVLTPVCGSPSTSHSFVPTHTLH